jgi:ribonucleoside-diphosphate reductase alpha chain
MSGESYLQSARISERMWPFAGYEVNRQPMLRVLNKHRSQAYKISSSLVPLDLLTAAREAWDRTCQEGENHGVRNSQISVLAPTGTIAFMMDCDTTGVEPDIALVKYKKLVGGGLLKIVNNTVPRALKRLGYESREIQEIVEYIDEHETIEGAPHLKDEHLAVFDCAFKPANGTRSIHYMGHLKMIGAVQPFISGAISKTINVPGDVTVEEIMHAYIEAWKLGVKAVAIYRDGSKRTQPLNTSKDEAKTPKVEGKAAQPFRRKLPDERHSITHKFDIAGHEGYITVGMYDDGQPGEIFITMSKEGSTISGLMDSFATSISMALQYGVPLRVLVDKFSHMRFEPSGFTKNPNVPFAKSIMDYIFRWLATKFLDKDAQVEVGVVEREALPSSEEMSKPAEPIRRLTAVESGTAKASTTVSNGAIAFNAPRGGAPLDSISSITRLYQQDAPPCPDCGAIMIRSGACYKCMNCGAVSGCS